MKIELENNILTAESDGSATDFDNIRAIIGFLHTKRGLEGVDVLKLKGFGSPHAIQMSVGLCNDMHCFFRVMALYIEQVGFEVQMSWDKNHPPGSVLP